MKIVLEDLKSFFRQLKFTAERKEGVFKSQSLERERERERERGENCDKENEDLMRRKFGSCNLTPTTYLESILNIFNTF